MYDIIYLEGDIMKKKLIIPIAIVLVLAITFTVFSVINSKVSVAFTPSKISGVNYNNYTFKYDFVDAPCQYIDYKDNKFAFIESNLFGSKLLIKDDAGKITTIKGVTAPFQLIDNSVAYKQNSTLYFKEENTNNLISKNVHHFLAYQDKVIYTKHISLDDGENLYVYNTKTKKSELLFKKAGIFCIEEDTLYLFKVDDDKNSLYKINLKDYNTTKVDGVVLWGSIGKIMVSNNHLIYLNDSNKIEIINLKSKKSKAVSLTTQNTYHDNISFVGDNNKIFCSIQAIYLDGPSSKKVDSQYNGTYKIDLKTYEKQKITDEVFDELYLFENNQLFGIKDKQIININIKP